VVWARARTELSEIPRPHYDLTRVFAPDEVNAPATPQNRAEDKVTSEEVNEGVRGFSGRLEEQMDTKTALQRVCSAPSSINQRPPSPSRRMGSGLILQLGQGEALTLVLVLSLGLWALIWAAVSLLR